MALLRIDNRVIIGGQVPDIEAITPCAAKLAIALLQLAAHALAVHHQVQEVRHGIAHEIGLPR